MDQKGFFSADILFATLLLIMVIAAAVNIISTGIDTAQNAQFSKAKVLADSLASTINAVYSDGDGTYNVFNFPNNTSNFTYTAVYVTNYGVDVQYNGKNSNSSIIPQNNLNRNNTVMYPGDVYNISNAGGTVIITKI